MNGTDRVIRVVWIFEQAPAGTSAVIEFAFSTNSSAGTSTGGCTRHNVANLRFAQDQQPQAQSNDDQQQALVEAIRCGGIGEATKIKKDYVGVYDPHWDWGLFNIEKLTKNSEAVIVGVPAKNRCKLSTDGQLITTDYDVVVQGTQGKHSAGLASLR